MTDEIRETLEKLRSAPDVVAEELQAAESVLASPDAVQVPQVLVVDSAPAAATPAAAEVIDMDRDIRSQISDMSMPQKVKLALFGNAVCRSLLILYPSRMIQQFVLKNPKLGMNEVEAFARNSNMSESVLRTIADSRMWMKTYAVKLNIVTNPRTPGDVSLKWLRFLQEPDLRKIAKSKNLPQLIVNMAKKRVADLNEH